MRWNLKPLISLSCEIIKFKYEGDVTNMLSNPQNYGGKAFQMDFGVLGRAQVSSGAIYTNTYERIVEVSDTFEWGFQTSLGVGMTAMADVSIPFIGKAAVSMSVDLNVGAKTDWKKKTKRTEKISHTVTLNKPGEHQLILCIIHS